MQNLIGWSSSIVLLGTIVIQIHRQWQEGSSKGVSKWLFIGQILASTGFVIYSWMVRDMVFIFTNTLLLLSAAVGLSIVLWHRRTNPDEGRSRDH